MIIVSHCSEQAIINNNCQGYGVDTDDNSVTISFYFPDSECIYLYFDDVDSAEKAVVNLNNKLKSIVYNSGIINVIEI